MREWQKIGIACFFGGFVCAIITLSIAPQFWWLGILAGFIVGYLGYDVKEIFLNIPIAYRKAKGIMHSKVFEPLWEKITEITPKVINWLFKTSNPLLTLSMIIGIPLWFLMAMNIDSSESLKTFPTAFIYFGNIVYYISAVTLLFYMFKLITIIGETKYTDKIGYSNFFICLFKGFYIIGKFIVWTIPKYIAQYIALGIYYIFKFSGLFVWFLFKQIHSYKRLLCGIDGVIGGKVALLILHNQATTLEAMILVTICGGLIGAVFGILNWEIVSVRLLKLHPIKIKV